VRYSVGIDLGTTWAAAAVIAPGTTEMEWLDTNSVTIPSALWLGDDNLVLHGQAAFRRALESPTRLVREFKRRIGDPTPLIVGGEARSAEFLLALQLRHILDHVIERRGGMPETVALSHPANWGNYKIKRFHETADMAGIGHATFVPEPVAAAIDYEAKERMPPGSRIAVYDLGGGTFDVAILEKTDDRFVIVGKAQGVEFLGGMDFDEIIFQHVLESSGVNLEDLDSTDPQTIEAVNQLRQRCIEAKEGLSTDTVSVIRTLLPTGGINVRITRTEFEGHIRPKIDDTITVLRQALHSAGITAENLSSVLLVGGSSRIPLVSQMVSSELGRWVAVDAHPKHAVALGTARLARSFAASGTGSIPIVTPKRRDVFRSHSHTETSSEISPPLPPRHDSATLAVNQADDQAAMLPSEHRESRADLAPETVQNNPRKPNIRSVPDLIPQDSPDKQAEDPSGPETIKPSPATVRIPKTHGIPLPTPRNFLSPYSEVSEHNLEETPALFSPESLYDAQFQRATAQDVLSTPPNDFSGTAQSRVQNSATAENSSITLMPSSDPRLFPPAYDMPPVRKTPTPSWPHRLLAMSILTALVLASGALWLWEQGKTSTNTTKHQIAPRIDVGKSPIGLAFGANSLWVTNLYGGTVSRINPATNKAPREIPVGSNPTGITVVANIVWVTNRNDKTVSLIDPTVNKVIHTFEVGNGPGDIVFADGAIWITMLFDNTVTRVDPQTYEIISRIPVGDDPRNIAVFTDENKDISIWVSNWNDDTVSRIDPKTNKVLATIQVGEHPTGIVAGDGSIWVANSRKDTVSRLDPKENKVIVTIPAGNTPSRIIYAAGKIWVTNEDDDTVTQIDPETNNFLTNIPVGDYPIGITTGAGSVWVANYKDDSILRIDINANPSDF